jgi:hypothetical protein
MTVEGSALKITLETATVSGEPVTRTLTWQRLA